MSWTAPACIDALAERFGEWEPLSGVEILAAPAEISLKGTDAGDALMFLSARGEQEFGPLGGATQEDRYMLECALVTTVNGLGQESATQARSRAGEVIGAVHACLTDISQNGLSALATDIGANQVFALKLANITLDRQGAEQNRRGCLVAFDIGVHARIS